MPFKKRLLRNLLVLPLALLLLNIIQDIAIYKLRVIDDPHQRVTIIIVMLLFGFSIVGFFITPLLEGLIERVYHTGKRSIGFIGGFGVLLLVCYATYQLYFQIYIHGVDTIVSESTEVPFSLDSIPFIHLKDP